METINPFIGTWQLVACETTDPDGAVTHPFGEHPVGYLFYAQDGHMAVEIMDPDRHQHDARPPTEPAPSQPLADADRVAAYSTYLSYCGTYSISIEEGMVTHHVKAALFPSWAGSDQRRRFRFEDGRLFLCNDATQLTWERAASHA